MNNKNQTLKNFIIMRDGQVVNDEYEAGQTEQARELVKTAFDNTRLELKMLVFDMFHGTDYRNIRRNLIREKKLKEFESSIGLVRK